MHTRFRNSVLTVIATLSLAACAGGGDGEGAAETATPAGDTAQAAMPGMEGTPGMQGMGGGGMMEQMQAHMRTMDGAGADSIQAMLPMHRQMVANMISQFGREMREMNMKVDAKWQATIDSLRQDNIRLPEMDAGELRAFMPGHRERVVRLLEMHRSMMAKM